MDSFVTHITDLLNLSFSCLYLCVILVIAILCCYVYSLDHCITTNIVMIGTLDFTVEEADIQKRLTYSQ